MLLVAAILCAYLGLVLAQTSAARDVSLDDVHWIFSFGDSYTDSGFNPTGQHPAPDCTLGNPSCITGNTLAGGHDWMTALTNVDNHSLTLTWNFAISGYVLDSDVVKSRSGVKQLQFQSFLSTSASKPEFAPWRGDNSLFSLFIGINDLDVAFQTANQTFFNAEFDTWTELMDQIYLLGGRQFLFVTVPDTTRAPMFSNLSPSDKTKLKDATVTWNKILRDRQSKFESSHPGVKTFLWDAYSQFNQILDNPKAFGFQDSTSTCSTGQCFWFNGLHPSSAAHLIFAKKVSDILADGGFWSSGPSIMSSSSAAAATTAAVKSAVAVESAKTTLETSSTQSAQGTSTAASSASSTSASTTESTDTEREDVARRLLEYLGLEQ